MAFSRAPRLVAAFGGDVAGLTARGKHKHFDNILLEAVL